jgi:hypothetical protein
MTMIVNINSLALNRWGLVIKNKFSGNSGDIIPIEEGEGAALETRQTGHYGNTISTGIGFRDVQ